MVRESISKCLFCILCIFLIMLVSSCGEESQDTLPSETGSAVFSIIWPESVENSSDDSNVTRAAGNPTVDCTGEGIIDVDVDVYNEANEHLTEASFQCTAGAGTVHDIIPGPNRKFVISGKNSDGYVIYQGEKGGYASWPKPFPL